MIPDIRVKSLLTSKRSHVEAFALLSEQELKKWIIDAIKEYFNGLKADESNLIDVNEPLLGRNEAAAYLRISTTTLTDWTKRGLPHYRVSGRIYYLKSEMLHFLRTELHIKAKFSDKYNSSPMT